MAYERPNKVRLFETSVFVPEGATIEKDAEAEPESITLRDVLEERLRLDGRTLVSQKTAAKQADVANREDIPDLASAVEKIGNAFAARETGDAKLTVEFEALLQKEGQPLQAAKALLSKVKERVLHQVSPDIAAQIQKAENQARVLQAKQRVEAEKAKLEILKQVRRKAIPALGSPQYAALETTTPGVVETLKEHPVLTGAGAGAAGVMGMRYLEQEREKGRR